MRFSAPIDHQAMTADSSALAALGRRQHTAGGLATQAWLLNVEALELCLEKNAVERD